VIVLCEIDGERLVIAVDDDRTPVGPLSATLRRAADQLDLTR
jgi:hypothetical protein